jgi:CheY-like chemotaxis protein
MMDNGIILCVDDDTSVLNALRSLLTHVFGGHRSIEIAESGEEALEILQELTNNGNHVSIVISDFIMPGMRGDELLIQFHHESPETITIMLTGQSDFDGVKKAINHANLYRFLEKPFNHDDILLTVKSAFLAYEHEQTLTLQNKKLKNLNDELGIMLKSVQDSERLLEERIAERTHELDDKNQALLRAMQTLEEMERIARHDLKTPLVSIAAAPHLLRAVRTMSAYEDEILNMIEKASNRALNMVNLSLDLFRMESGTYDFRPSSIDLTEIATSIAVGLKAHASSKLVQIEVKHEMREIAAQPHFYCEGDDSLCYSIIGNLTKNAVEAAPENSVVILNLIDGEKIQLCIHNQGAVPEALRENFFTKYATSGKDGGTGLGTYSSHLLAKAQGGSLTMQTSEQEGTTLCLTLARAAAPSVVLPQNEHTSSSAAYKIDHHHLQRSVRVLLADDDEFNQMVMSEYIPQPRFDLDTAINGRMALESVMLVRPDIVIMDLDMPIMGGAEALKQIRDYQFKNAQRPSVVVAFSGNDDAASRAAYLALGFDTCLNKPSSREEVIALLDAYLQ